MKLLHLTIDNAKDWHQHTDKRIYLADVVGPGDGSPMSAGFARYDRKGERNDWTLSYDEFLIITRGSFTVRTGDGSKTARAGEVLFLPRGTALTYEAAEDSTELVYVTYPHWLEAQTGSAHAALLDAFHPVEPSPGRDPI